MNTEELTTPVSRADLIGQSPCAADVDDTRCEVTDLAIRLGAVPPGTEVRHAYATRWVNDGTQFVERLFCIYCNKPKA